MEIIIRNDKDYLSIKLWLKKEKFLKIFHSTEFFRVSLDAVVVE